MDEDTGVRVPGDVGRALMSKEDAAPQDVEAVEGSAFRPSERPGLLEEIAKATSETHNPSPSAPAPQAPCQSDSQSVPETEQPEESPDPPAPHEVASHSVGLLSKIELLVLEDIERKMANNNLGLEELVAILGRVSDIMQSRIWTERLARHITENPSALLPPAGGGGLMAKVRGLASQDRKASKRDGRGSGERARRKQNHDLPDE